MIKYSVTELAAAFCYELPCNEVGNKTCLTCQLALSVIIAVTSSVQLSVSKSGISSVQSEAIFYLMGRKQQYKVTFLYILDSIPRTVLP